MASAARMQVKLIFRLVLLFRSQLLACLLAFPQQCAALGREAVLTHPRACKEGATAREGQNRKLEHGHEDEEGPTPAFMCELPNKVVAARIRSECAILQPVVKNDPYNDRSAVVSACCFLLVSTGGHAARGQNVATCKGARVQMGVSSGA
ncbi:hypothetical protein ACK3TF_000416 [Chlorella vulgaris]